MTIIISRPDKIGDVVISSSCLSVIKRHLPNAKIYWLVEENLLPLFYKHLAIETCLTVPKSAQDKEALTQTFKEIKAEAIVHLNPHPDIESSAFAAGIETRIGYSKDNKKHLTHAFPDERKKGLKHEAFYNFDLLKPLGIEIPQEPSPWLTLDPRSIEQCQAIIHQYGIQAPYAVFHLGASGKKPRLPASITAPVAQWLVKEKQLSIVLVGNRADEPEEAEFLSTLNEQRDAIISLCGKTDLAETAALYQKAAFAFSRDTGPAHIAAAMQCPCLTVFAEPNPSKSAKRWKPLGPHSDIVENDIKQRFWENEQAFAKRNFSMFNLETIYQKIEALLK